MADETPFLFISGFDNSYAGATRRFVLKNHIKQKSKRAQKTPERPLSPGSPLTHAETQKARRSKRLRSDTASPSTTESSGNEANMGGADLVADDVDGDPEQAQGQQLGIAPLIRRKLGLFQRDDYDMRKTSGVRQNSSKRRRRSSFARVPDSNHLVQPSPIRVIYAHPDRATQELRSLGYYSERVAQAMASYFDKVSLSVSIWKVVLTLQEFWLQTVLQLNETHPAVRHLLVATGALYETFSSQELVLSASHPRKMEVFFLEQYAKAFPLLQANLETPIANAIAITVCCVLLVLIDKIRDRSQFAKQHLEGAMKVLQQVISTDSSQVAVVKTDLVPTIERLLLSFGGCNNVVADLFEPPTFTIESLQDNDGFIELKDAMAALYAVAEDVFNSFQAAVAKNDMNAATTTVHQGGEYLEAWLTRFNTAFSDGALYDDQFFQRAALSLLIQHRAIKILVATALAEDEMCFDQYATDFAAIVNMAQSYFRSENLISSSPRRFRFEPAIIPPLAHTGLRCRDPTIRHEALELLSEPRQEGHWTSTTSATIISHVIDMEERGLSPVKTASDIPSTNRTRVLRCRFHPGKPPAKHHFELDCVGYPSFDPMGPPRREIIQLGPMPCWHLPSHGAWQFDFGQGTLSWASLLGYVVPWDPSVVA